MKQIKAWYAKKADDQRRRLAWLGSGILALIAVLAVIVTRFNEMVTAVFAGENSDRVGDIDLPSLLFFGGAILLLFVIMGFPSGSTRGAMWEETGRRNRIASKHPWARKQDR